MRPAKQVTFADVIDHTRGWIADVLITIAEKLNAYATRRQR